VIHYVLFDAVGTLIYPRPSVAEIYTEVGARFGSSLTFADIRPRFAAAYRRVFRECDDLATNGDRERERWQAVVAEVFADVPHAVEPIFAALWDHFAQPQHWELYDDVAPVWRELSSRGFVLAIASNFDSRLRQILAGHDLLADCPHVFVSSEIGHAKPSPEYYRAVERRLAACPEEILIVGDDLENDVVAPRRAGWRALALTRRTGEIQHFDDEETLASLSELPSRLA
jgi:putative hydrolase of the HAD superfamily